MDTSDPRVVAILAHAEACREAFWGEESRPPLPHELKDLSGIDLSGANLEDADLRGSDLIGADLTGANLRGAYLEDADLNGAKLNGANLNRAKIGFADLTNARVTQAQLEEAFYRDVEYQGYPKEVAEKVILFHETVDWNRVAKKRLVVELRADGKLHIKNRIFKY
jgi:hypothetical protein